MRLKSQLHFPGLEKSGNRSHGGDLNHGKRKTLRPIDPKQALHVVLKSSKAKGEFSFLHPRHCNSIELFVKRTARKWGVRLYRYANVGNHLHLLVQVPTREAWKQFSKELSGGIAQLVTGAQKGSALSRSNDPDTPESAKRGFWDHLLFTRIVNFGRDFKSIRRYFIKNFFEAAGVPVTRLLKMGYKIVLLEPGEYFQTAR
jgi:REP element-mobilizing transposase RayT